MATETILILGGNSGIGLAIARRFAREGYHIQLAARQIHRLESDKSDIEIRLGVTVSLVEFDAGETASHEKFFSSLPVIPDVTVCAFGYLGDHVLAQSSWLEAEKIIQVNFTGMTSILSIVANHYEQQKKGTIVGISSVAGDRGRASNYYYGAAKAGMTTFLSGLRQRLFPSGVHVVTIKPGFVRTAMTSHLALPPVITAEPATVAEDVFRAVQKRRNVVYSLSLWAFIMFIVCSIPEFVFKRVKL